MALSSATKEMGDLGVSWTDPDPADSSSEESRDGSAKTQKHQKRVNREIEFSDPAIALTKTATKKRKKRRPIDPSSCGTYQRPNGKWSSEIRSGRMRIWLGTFDTKEEARTAYLSKKMEIDATRGGRGSAKRKGKAVLRDPIRELSPEEAKAAETESKRVKLEMEELVASPSSVQAFGSSDTGGCSESVVQGPAKSKRTSQRPYTGVFSRTGKKWSAEVRDPFKKSKVHLGTFGSPEEARDAIVARKLQFDARRLNPEKGELVASRRLFQFGSSDSGGNSAAEECGLAAEYDGSAKELAVLKRFTEGRGGHDLKYVMQIASHIIDRNGNFLGEFSSLDDLQIR